MRVRGSDLCPFLAPQPLSLHGSLSEREQDSTVDSGVRSEVPHPPAPHQRQAEQEAARGPEQHHSGLKTRQRGTPEGQACFVRATCCQVCCSSTGLLGLQDSSPTQPLVTELSGHYRLSRGLENSIFHCSQWISLFITTTQRCEGREAKLQLGKLRLMEVLVMQFLETEHAQQPGKVGPGLLPHKA